ncbi:prepilin-type N-terminal cleavage/methylation domain-containing protein [bacterium]|nr:prepilin-type N-terminal cleavage/methylation domain-containing protein [bacterium]
MRKNRAFTLIEVMVSIFIFTTSMLGYMAFHAHSMSVLFENESAQFAHALAFNLVEEFNSMSYDSFKELAGTGSVVNLQESTLQNDKYLGANYRISPFYMTGSASYAFYRNIVIAPYSMATGTYVQPGTYLSTLYQIEVSVYWPKMGHGEYPCTNSSSAGFDDNCNALTIPLVRSNRAY